MTNEDCSDAEPRAAMEEYCRRGDPEGKNPLYISPFWEEDLA
jgi:hypothetical protein